MRTDHNSSRKPFLTVADVADLLKLSQKTVHRLITAQQLPAHKFGRLWRISRADLESFMSSRRQGRSSYGL